jgi:hypothetical protein
MCVAQIRTERWQTTLDIDATTMPLDKRIDGQPMA